MASRRPASSVRPAVDRRRPLLFTALTAIVAAVLFWVWPSSLSRVKNLDSPGTTIVAFGDSLTAGYGASEEEAYPAQLAKAVSLDIVNAGVSGDTTEGALSRIDTDVLSLSPRIVIVGLGGNDFLRRVPITTTEQHLREIVRRSHAAGAMVILLGFRFPSFGPSYETMYERVADEEGCLLVADVLDGILSDPAMKSDEIHPNARGYLLMSERVAGPLNKLIARNDAAR